MARMNDEMESKGLSMTRGEAGLNGGLCRLSRKLCRGGRLTRSLSQSCHVTRRSSTAPPCSKCWTLSPESSPA